MDVLVIVNEMVAFPFIEYLLTWRRQKLIL